MLTSKNTEVQKWLDDVMLSDDLKYDILQGLRKVVLENYPDINERIMYGGIMFSGDSDFGGIFKSKNHVSFEFGQGYMMQDPEKILEGTGKFRRHIKIKTVQDIEGKHVDFFVKQVGG